LFGVALLSLLALASVACGSDPPKACEDGAVEELACGINGRGTETRVCASGSFEDPGQCEDSDECADGDRYVLACGPKGTGTLVQECWKGTWNMIGDCIEADDCAGDALLCGWAARGGSATLYNIV
jgi:hypothetical protein